MRGVTWSARAASAERRSATRAGALGGLGREGVRQRQHQPPEDRQGDVGIHPRALGEPADPARQALPPHRLPSPLDRAPHLVLEVRRPLLHHHQLVHPVGEAAHQARVDRRGEPQAQHRHPPVDPQLGQRRAQQHVRRPGGHDAHPRVPEPVRPLDPVEAGGADGRVQARHPPLDDVRLQGSCLRRQRHRVGRAHGRGVEGHAPQRADLRGPVRGQLDDAGAVGLRRRADQADHQLALGREVEGEPHEVLQLLGARRLEHRHARARQREAAVGADLGRRERRVVPDHDDRGGAGGRQGGVGDGEPVQRHVGADALHDRHPPGARDLAGAVEHRRALGLVVGQLRLDAQLGQVGRVGLADREDLGDRGAGIPGDERDAGLERALHDQLVAVEHRAPRPSSQGRLARGPRTPVGRDGGHGGLPSVAGDS